MYEIEFVSSASTQQSDTRKYDAIVLRFMGKNDPRPYVVVVDAGYPDIGQVVVNHIIERYGTNRVDLLISTHADQDHINGIPTVLEQLEVGEVLIHQPRLHSDNANSFSNIQVVDRVLDICARKGVKCDEEPFAGVERFDGRLVILGPNISLYEEMLMVHLDEVSKNEFPKYATSQTPLSSTLYKALKAVNQVLAYLPLETLGNGGRTGPRNNSSVITAINIDGHRMMLTGDAGIPALEMAADEYEYRYGDFAQAPLGFFQAPHHGSKRNLGVDILDRILGPKGAGYNKNIVIFIATAFKSLKHPSSKVTNALMRRGCQQRKLGVTKSRLGYLRHSSGDAPVRDDASPLGDYPIMSEDD